MRKSTLLLLILQISVFSFHSSFAQVGEWVWLHGNNTANGLPTFGTQGVTAPTNIPPAVYEACEWADTSGNFWMFGGRNSTNYWGALWKYDPSINQWTWMKGPNTTSPGGVYGTQ